MKKIAIIYGSSTHNTDVKDVSSVSPDDFEAYDHLFLGTSTLGSVSADGYTFDDLKAFRNGEAANPFTEETERLFWQFGFV